MSAQYTQGRVKVQHPHAGERGYEVAFEPGLEQLCQNITEANARRLAACWNACDGISTEALEVPGIIQQRIESACGELYEVKRQRDELLAALKDLLNYDNLGAYERANARQQARAAIARVE